MRRPLLIVFPLLVLAFLLAASAAPALAQAKEGTKTSRSIQTVARIDGASAYVMEGAQVPIPGQGEGGKAYTYQSVGLSLHVEAVSVAGRSVRLHGKLEDSSLQGPSAPPIFRTWTHELGDVVVTEGKPLEVSALKAAD